MKEGVQKVTQLKTDRQLCTVESEIWRQKIGVKNYPSTRRGGYGFCTSGYNPYPPRPVGRRIVWHPALWARLIYILLGLLPSRIYCSAPGEYEYIHTKIISSLFHFSAFVLMQSYRHVGAR